MKISRTFAALSFLVLVACATPTPREPTRGPQLTEDDKRLFDSFAKMCEKSGHAAGSAEWFSCTRDLYLSVKDPLYGKPLPDLPPGKRSVTCTPNRLGSSVTCQED